MEPRSAAVTDYLWWVGKLPGWARFAIGIAGLLLFIPEGYTDIAGVVIAAAAIVVVRASRPRLAAG